MSSIKTTTESIKTIETPIQRPLEVINHEHLMQNGDLPTNWTYDFEPTEEEKARYPMLRPTEVKHCESDGEDTPQEEKPIQHTIPSFTVDNNDDNDAPAVFGGNNDDNNDGNAFDSFNDNMDSRISALESEFQMRRKYNDNMLIMQTQDILAKTQDMLAVQIARGDHFQQQMLGEREHSKMLEREIAEMKQALEYMQKQLNTTREHADILTAERDEAREELRQLKAKSKPVGVTVKKIVTDSPATIVAATVTTVAKPIAATVAKPEATTEATTENRLCYFQQHCNNANCKFIHIDMGNYCAEYAVTGSCACVPAEKKSVLHRHILGAVYNPEKDTEIVIRGVKYMVPARPVKNSHQ